MFVITLEHIEKTILEQNKQYDLQHKSSQHWVRRENWEDMIFHRHDQDGPLIE